MGQLIKYLITNLVYGDLYLKIFLEQHLKSVLDDTNLSAIINNGTEVHYRIFTDEQTAPKFNQHPNFKRLCAIAKVDLLVVPWEKEFEANKFGARYTKLLQAFHLSLEISLNEKFDYLTAWVADLVVAREFFPRILQRMNEGHGAVFVLPLRAAFESTPGIFNQINRALTDYDLFKLGFEHLHPLWVACEWRNNRFTRLPFSMLWSTKTGIMARSFSVTPIIFKPTQAMLESRGMIDGDIPALCDNPYWCHDWTDAPVIGIEPLFCYYPPFKNQPASVYAVREWAHRYEKGQGGIHPTQRPYLKKHLYYPNKKHARIGIFKKLKSNLIVRGII